MATLREIICSEGVDTLREYMCVETGEGGGDVYITDGVIKVVQSEGVKVSVEEESVKVVESKPVKVTTTEESIKVKISDSEKVKEVCE